MDNPFYLERTYHKYNDAFSTDSRRYELGSDQLPHGDNTAYQRPNIAKCPAGVAVLVPMLTSYNTPTECFFPCNHWKHREGTLNVEHKILDGKDNEIRTTDLMTQDDVVKRTVAAV